MEYRSVLLSIIILLFSTVAVGLYLVTDYYMDPKFPKIFGQVCDKTIQDDCLWLNSHLNTFGLANYGSNRDCVTTLDAGNHPGALYKLKWKRFKIESGDCSNDYLELYDTSMDSVNASTNLIGRLCGRSYPNITGYPTQQYLTFKWHTNGGREDKGFRVLATRNLPYPCSDDFFHCKAENRCIDGRLKCDGVEQCDDGEDESSCSGWEKFVGKLLALGTAGIVGVSGAVLFGCILIGCIICAVTCCRQPCGKCWKAICKPCRKHRKIHDKEGSTQKDKKNNKESADGMNNADSDEKVNASKENIKTSLPQVTTIPVTPSQKANETATPIASLQEGNTIKPLVAPEAELQETSMGNKSPSPAMQAESGKLTSTKMPISEQNKNMTTIDV